MQGILHYKMTFVTLYRSLMMVVGVLAHTSRLASASFGDKTVQDYLQLFCGSENTKSKSVLILFDQRNPKAHSPLSQVENTLQRMPCPYVSYHNVDQSQVTALFNSNSSWRHLQLALVFDFTLSEVRDKTHFISLLTFLDKVYANCDRCLPLLACFDIATEQLLRWTESVLSILKKNFRSILVPLRDAAKSSVHIHPVLRGCQMHSGVLVPRSAAQMNMLKTPFSMCNLQSEILNISFNNGLPYCEIVQQSGQTIINYALETEILKILEFKFNFRSNLIDGKQTWGRYVNGTWTGVVGHVYNGSSDLGICDISQTTQRLRVVDFAYSIYVDELSFISQSPGLKSRDLIVAHPFNWIVWLCFCSSFVIFNTVFYLVLRAKWNSTSKKPSGVNIFLKLFAISMGQSTKLLWRDLVYIRILYSVWILSVLVLSHSYGGRFYSLLTLPEFDSPIDTLNDLENIALTDSGFLVTIDHSSYLDAFLTAQYDKGIYYLIGQHIARTRQQMVEMDKEASKSVEQRPRTTLIASRLFLATMRRVYATKPLHIGQDSLSMDFISFIFAKKSPLLKPFSWIIKRMCYTGLVEKLLSNTFDRLPSKTGGNMYQNPTVATEGQLETLALKDLRSVFIVWSMGVALSLVSFVHEAFIHYICDRLKSRNILKPL